MNHISVGRLYLGLVVLAFTVYLIPEFGSTIKIISGFPPLWLTETVRSWNSKGGSNASAQILPEGAHLGPRFDRFWRLWKGLAYANQKSLFYLILQDMHNCRKMEDFVWSDPAILKYYKMK
jgi:thiol:disulfide interchange protein DsbD